DAGLDAPGGLRRALRGGRDPKRLSDWERVRGL
ncbi:MAG: hypothetical protein AVDCRST_MAG55-3253, partial [uncultured Rubrobacteraceae bacterium]